MRNPEETIDIAEQSQKYKRLNKSQEYKKTVIYETDALDFLDRQFSGKVTTEGKAFHNFWVGLSAPKKTEHDYMRYVMKNIDYFMKLQGMHHDAHQDMNKICLSKEEFHECQARLESAQNHIEALAFIKGHPKLEFLQQRQNISTICPVPIPMLFLNHCWDNTQKHISWEILAKTIDKFWIELSEHIVDLKPKQKNIIAKILGWKGVKEKQSPKENMVKFLPRYFMAKILAEQCGECYNPNIAKDEKNIARLHHVAKRFVIFKNDEKLLHEELYFNNKNYNERQRNLSFYVEDSCLLLLAIYYLKSPKEKKDVLFKGLLKRQSTAIDIEGTNLQYMVSVRSNHRKINGIINKDILAKIAQYIHKNTKKKQLYYDDFHRAIGDLSAQSIHKIACLLEIEKQAFDEAKDKSVFYRKSNPKFAAACAHIFPEGNCDEISALRNSLFHFDLSHKNLDKIPKSATKWQNLYNQKQEARQKWQQKYKPYNKNAT